MTFFDPDTLLRKYGLEKTVPNLGGEYKTWGPLRTIEQRVDISTLTTSYQILNDVLFFPKGCFVESVELEVQTAVATITSVTFGMVQTNDRSTTISDPAFVNAQTTAALNTAGFKITYIAGTSLAGSAIGTVPIATSAGFAGHIVGKIAGSAGTGVVLLRINYRMDPTSQGDV